MDEFDFYQEIFNNLPKFQVDSYKKGFDEYDEYIKLDVIKKGKEFGYIDDIGSQIIKKKFFLKKKENISQADIFWIVPFNLFLIKGSMEISKIIMKELKFIFNDLENHEIDIDNDFLMWIACQYSTNKGKLSDTLYVDQIDQNGTIKSAGGSSVSRVNEINLKKGHETDLSLPAIYGLVNDHKFSLIGGDFVHKGTTVNLKMTTKNVILAYSSKKGLKNKDMEKKYGMLFHVLNEMALVIDQWFSLDKVLKYPDESYMDAMTKSFEEQVEECRHNLTKLKEKYSKKRESSSE